MIFGKMNWNDAMNMTLSEMALFFESEVCQEISKELNAKAEYQQALMQRLDILIKLSGRVKR